MHEGFTGNARIDVHAHIHHGYEWVSSATSLTSSKPTPKAIAKASTLIRPLRQLSLRPFLPDVSPLSFSLLTTSSSMLTSASDIWERPSSSWTRTSTECGERRWEALLLLGYGSYTMWTVVWRIRNVYRIMSTVVNRPFLYPFYRADESRQPRRTRRLPSHHPCPSLSLRGNHDIINVFI